MAACAPKAPANSTNGSPVASRAGNSGALVQDYRRDQLHAMKHIHWLWAGTGLVLRRHRIRRGRLQIIPVQDLASRYRFRPLVSASWMAARSPHISKACSGNTARPCSSNATTVRPSTNQHVDEVMARFGVLPLNNPPHFPRYNGGMEKSIRDFKAALDQRLQSSAV